MVVKLAGSPRNLYESLPEIAGAPSDVTHDKPNEKSHNGFKVGGHIAPNSQGRG